MSLFFKKRTVEVLTVSVWLHYHFTLILAYSIMKTIESKESALFHQISISTLWEWTFLFVFQVSSAWVTLLTNMIVKCQIWITEWILSLFLTAILSYSLVKTTVILILRILVMMIALCLQSTNGWIIQFWWKNLVTIWSLWPILRLKQLFKINTTFCSLKMLKSLWFIAVSIVQLHNFRLKLTLAAFLRKLTIFLSKR